MGRDMVRVCVGGFAAFWCCCCSSCYCLLSQLLPPVFCRTVTGCSKDVCCAATARPTSQQCASMATRTAARGTGWARWRRRPRCAQLRGCGVPQWPVLQQALQHAQLAMQLLYVCLALCKRIIALCQLELHAQEETVGRKKVKWHDSIKTL